MSASAAAAAPSGVAHVKSSASLDFGRIYSAIMSASAGNPPKAILFVSPGQRQGATTIAAGVALTAAQANPDLRLGLLDCNFRTPQLDKLFQIPASPGVVDGLAGSTALSELGYAVGVHSNLFVIPSGQVTIDPLSMFRYEKMANLIKSLASRFRVLLVDTAPVNLYPDAQIFTGIMDASVMVVDAGSTPREAVAKAKQILQTGRGKLVGTVLNRRSHPVPGILYGRS